MIDHDEIAVVQVGYECDWTSVALRNAYDTAKDRWIAGAPDMFRLGADAPGLRKRYGSFKGKRPHLEKADFDKVGLITLVRLAPNGRNEITDWCIFSTFYPPRRRIEIGSCPTIVGAVSERLIHDFQDLARSCRVRYGFLFRQRMWLGPKLYAGGGNLYIDDDPRHGDTKTNHSWWGLDSVARVHSAALLRDIYPESYLSEPYLAARLGRTRTTLKQWIEADPGGRGTLEPYTDILTKWTPPVERIPQIREELFRAGRVYFWKFFCPPPEGRAPDPFFRPDLSAPWEAPEPIPEIYRADYWKDKDPGLTY